MKETLVELRDAGGVLSGDGEGELFLGGPRRRCYVNEEMNPPVYAPTSPPEVLSDKARSHVLQHARNW